MRSISNNRFININFALYIIYIISYLIIFIFYEKNEAIFDLKHYILLFNCVFAFFSFLIKNGRKFYSRDLFGKKIIFILITGVIFIIMSYFSSVSAGVDFSFRSIVQTSLFVLPLVYVFFLINIFDRKTIKKMLMITTGIFVFFYFCESKHSLISFFIIDNWLNIDLKSSNSFTESHICAETFLQLFIYFYYMYNYIDKDKKTLLFMFVSLIFTILSFKRLALLFVFLLIISRIFLKFEKKQKIKLNLLLSLIMVIITILYVNLLTGKIDIGIDMNKFTTNRVWILSLWERKKYFSYGYGTSLYVIGRYLEMDLVQIYFELGVAGLMLFVFSMFQLADKRLYTNIILLYVLFNLLTSSTMPWTSGWVILGFNLMLLSSDKYNSNYTEGKNE